MIHPIAESVAITPESTVSVTVLYVLITTAIVGTGLAYGIFYRLGTLTNTVRSLLAHGWTVADHRHWSTQLADRNKHLNVPAVEKIVPVDSEGE